MPPKKSSKVPTKEESTGKRKGKEISESSVNGSSSAAVETTRSDKKRVKQEDDDDDAIPSKRQKRTWQTYPAERHLLSAGCGCEPSMRRSALPSNVRPHAPGEQRHGDCVCCLQDLASFPSATCWWEPGRSKCADCRRKGTDCVRITVDVCEELKDLQSAADDAAADLNDDELGEELETAQHVFNSAMANLRARQEAFLFHTQPAIATARHLAMENAQVIAAQDRAAGQIGDALREISDELKNMTRILCRIEAAHACGSSVN